MSNQSHETSVPREYTMFEPMYEMFEAALLQTSGKSFKKLVVDEPVMAYRSLRRFHEAVIRRSASGFVEDEAGRTIADSDQDGVEATRGMAAYQARESVVDTDIEPVEVVLSVVRKAKGTLFQPRAEVVDEVARFRIEPPDLVW